MKKRRIWLLWLVCFVISVAYISLLVCLVEIPPFDTILPFGLLVIMFLLVGVAPIISFFWVAANNMLMFERNKAYENEYCMFFLDIVLGTCYQAIKRDDTFYFIKIGNGLFAIKEKRICKDAAALDECIRRGKAKIVHVAEIRKIELIEGTHAVDLIKTYKYDRYTAFSSEKFYKMIQSVFNASAERIMRFFCGENVPPQFAVNPPARQ